MVKFAIRFFNFHLKVHERIKYSCFECTNGMNHDQCCNEYIFSHHNFCITIYSFQQDTKNTTKLYSLLKNDSNTNLV